MGDFDVGGINFRPMDRWPGALTRSRRGSPFYAKWGDTLELLNRELRALGAKNVFVQVALDPSDFRNDGTPRARAQARHPGVILTLDSKYGPLQYPCDTFWDWQSNVRAIALALEALRKVDRYGVTKHGEQYTGWKQLGSGMPMGSGSMSVEDAAQFMSAAVDGIHSAQSLIDSRDRRKDAYRRAAQTMHPDVRGGSEEQFKKLQEAKAVLDRYAG